MGIAVAVLFALIIAAFGVYAFGMYTRVKDPWLRSLCLGMGGATIGFAIVGVFLHVWEATTVSIVFWLLAGIVVASEEIEARSGTSNSKPELEEDSLTVLAPDRR
jgi:hypothetical protein